VLARPGRRRLIAAAQGIKSALSPALQEGDGDGAPTARIMRHLGLETSAFGVANHLRDVLDAIVLRPGDDVHRERIAGLGVRPHLAGAASGIPSPPHPAALARQLLDAALAPPP
ncbi:MAG: hypothetical protein ACE5G8_16235, partial [Anaerolineae bacterium]